MKQRGFALMLVIWVLILLSILASSFSRRTYVETETGAWLADQVRLQAASHAAISRGILGLAVRDNELRWKTNGQVYPFSWNEIPVQLVLRNESGKLDLNYAPRSMIVGLLQAQLPNKSAYQLTDALIDWRDRDNTPGTQGAEASDYLNAGYRHVPANGPLTSVAELSQVMGFDGDTVEKLRPYVTVFSRRPKVDASSAPTEVIAAIPGIDESLATQFVTDRDQALAEGTAVSYDALSQGQRYIEVRPSSSVINIEARITLEGVTHREQAVVRLQSSRGSFEILAWHVLPDTTSQDPSQVTAQP